MNPSATAGATTETERSEVKRTIVALILASVISGLVWGLVVALHLS